MAYRSGQTFGAPITVDGEDKDAFRRQVGEVGEDAEDLAFCELRPDVNYL